MNTETKPNNEFRVRMGIEIDEMKRWWAQKNVQTYFEQMISETTKKDAKNNGFDFKQFPINILYDLFFEYNKNDVFSFKFFEYGFDKDGQKGNDNWELYSKLRKLHLIMQEWFNDRRIYHYLGYLFFRFKQSSEFKNIFELWEESSSKKNFSESLKKRIVENITKEDNLESLCKEIENICLDWYSESYRVVNILILQDIISCINNESESFNRLNVEYFSKNKEDIEHINCRIPSNKEKQNKEKWESFIDSIPEVFPQDKDEMKKILKDEKVSEEQINQLIKELNQYGLNSIGNLVLLNSSINRSYGNSPYVDKRLQIIKNYYKYEYIRPHTFKVFIKGNDADIDLNNWSLADIIKNAKSIAEGIKNWAEKPEEEM